MMKKNKTTLIITSILILLPMLIGILLWNQLPEIMATHFGVNGQADGYSSKTLTVFGLPLFLLILQWICAFATSHDPKQQNISPKVFTFILWIIPVISIVVNSLVYLVNLGKAIDVSFVVLILLGMVFIFTGNYLPKSRRNYTVGIKTPWTLENDVVWNKTNRLGGYLFMGIGFLTILTAFVHWIPMELFLVGIILATFIPVIYSYLLYNKENH